MRILLPLSAQQWTPDFVFDALGAVRHLCLWFAVPCRPFTLKEKRVVAMQYLGLESILKGVQQMRTVVFADLRFEETNRLFPAIRLTQKILFIPDSYTKVSGFDP